MESLNNKHIVLILLVIIIGVFIYNFDVYVVSKGEPICKPIFITKREISPEVRAELNKTEQIVRKETFDNLNKDGYFEQFSNLEAGVDIVNPENPVKLFSSIVFSNLTNSDKIKVIDSVNKILALIPTNLSEEQIYKLMQYLITTYQNSSNLEDFYSKVYENAKENEVLPIFKTKYTHLILYLIGRFDTSYNKMQQIRNIVNKTVNDKPQDVMNISNINTHISLDKNQKSEVLLSSPRIKKKKFKRLLEPRQVSFNLDNISNVSRISSDCDTKCNTGCSLTLGNDNLTRTNNMIQMNQQNYSNQINQINNRMENFSQMNNMNTLVPNNNFDPINNSNQVSSFNDIDYAGFSGF